MLQPSSHQQLAAVEADLAQARTFESVLDIVRPLARSINRADGATFVLKDGAQCFYADEDAIGPLWKGRRFPQTSCISGWVMMYGTPAVIEDIFQDPRIPLDAYQPTFVRSLLMVPVGQHTPIAAIGNYWASPHRASPPEVDRLMALANAASRAISRLRQAEPMSA